VHVRLTWRDDALDVEITDDGHGGPGDDEGGHGLAGMRERVAVAGGSLVAGPGGTGFRVAASLPLAGPSVD
ncbi:MAG: sensor histidine kinase, partial [Nonomuraea sp.]|nr:sensor histidine kinase [Nonomuraea sp.]